MIIIDRNHKYFGLQRHFSRAQNPPPGKIWDWDCPLAEKATGQALKMRGHYFPRSSPTVAFHSRIPRAKKTVELMWPSSRIVEDPAFGPDDPATADAIWAKSQNLPVTASGVEIYAADPEVIERASMVALGSIVRHVIDLPLGEFAWAGSHCPYTDVVLATCRESLLALAVNTGWLPGQFGSGAFAWLTFNDSDKLVSAEYYPAL